LKIRVIGIGTPFGGDPVGADLVTALSRRGCCPTRPIDWRLARDGGPALLAQMQDCDLVILVDALVSATPPFGPRLLRPDDLREPPATCSSHGLSLPGTLQLGRQLDMLPRRLRLIGIAMPDPTRPFSADQIETLAAQLEELLRQLVEAA
jgi:hydrogenase maturation protease